MINVLANCFNWPDNTITFRRMRVNGPRFTSIVWVTEIRGILKPASDDGEFLWDGPAVMEVALEGTLEGSADEIDLERIVREFFRTNDITFTVSVD